MSIDRQSSQDGNNAGRATGVLSEQGLLDRWIAGSTAALRNGTGAVRFRDGQRCAKQRVVKERIGQHQHTRDIGGAGMASYIIVRITAFGFGVA